MTEVYSWAKDILLLLVALSFFQILIPDSSMAKYLRFIYSLVILAVILDPLAELAGKLEILT